MTLVTVYLGGVTLVLLFGALLAAQGAAMEWETSRRFPRWLRYGVFVLVAAVLWPLIAVMTLLVGVP